MKNSKHITEIQTIVTTTPVIRERIKKLTDKGYTVERRRMGVSKRLQVKTVRDETRVQISHGTGSNNYAYAVILKAV